jgi:hypothetical protein
MFGSISMPMLVAIFVLALLFFGPVGPGPRGPCNDDDSENAVGKEDA